MSKKLQHALHNKCACDAIASLEGNFHDWVIKAAYDSASEFVKHTLFPRTETHPRTNITSVYESFDAYYNAFAPFIQKDKDDAIIGLVISNLPAISSSFKRLRDLNMYAKLNGHKVSEKSAKLSRELLESISSHCNTVKSPSPIHKEEKIDTGI